MASKNTSTTSDGDAERLRRHYHLKHPLETQTRVIELLDLTKALKP